MFAFSLLVLEAKDIDLKTPTNIYALVRFGDHEMRTKSLPSPAPKWKEAIKLCVFIQLYVFI